jgi:hypothetical protein
MKGISSILAAIVQPLWEAVITSVQSNVSVNMVVSPLLGGLDDAKPAANLQAGEYAKGKDEEGHGGLSPVLRAGC